MTLMETRLSLTPALWEGVVPPSAAVTALALHALAAQAAPRSVAHRVRRPSVVADTLCAQTPIGNVYCTSKSEQIKSWLIEIQMSDPTEP